MSKPRIKSAVKKPVPQVTEPRLTITNPSKLPKEVKDSLVPVRGAIQQMIDQYIDDTVLYLRSGIGDKKRMIMYGESLKKLLKGLNSSPKELDPASHNYPNNYKIKR